MNLLHRTSIEQWLVLQTVIDSGSFTAAAVQLHRSQSSVSYAIAKLQEQLGVELVQINGRKVKLTAMGEVLLQDARPLIKELKTLEMRAKVLMQGTEAKVRLVVDSIYPKDLLFTALSQFTQNFPHTNLELTEAFRLTPLRDNRVADLYMALPPQGGLPGEKLLDVALMAVAHRDHPLQQLDKPALSLADLAHHVQVSLGDTSSPVHDSVAMTQQRWSVNTIDAALAAVQSKLCFGWLPSHAIETALATDELRLLPLAIGQIRYIPMYLVYADHDRAGPATRALADEILRVKPPSACSG